MPRNLHFHLEDGEDSAGPLPRILFLLREKAVYEVTAASGFSRFPALQVPVRISGTSWEECLLRYLLLRGKEVWKPFFFFDGGALGAFPGES